MKNWFGYESHPSDEMLSWQDQTCRSSEEFSAYVKHIRSMWDHVKAAGCEDDLKKLLQIKYELAITEERYYNSEG